MVQGFAEAAQSIPFRGVQEFTFSNLLILITKL